MVNGLHCAASHTHDFSQVHPHVPTFESCPTWPQWPGRVFLYTTALRLHGSLNRTTLVSSARTPKPVAFHRSFGPSLGHCLSKTGLVRNAGALRAAPLGPVMGRCRIRIAPAPPKGAQADDDTREPFSCLHAYLPDDGE